MNSLKSNGEGRRKVLTVPLSRIFTEATAGVFESALELLYPETRVGVLHITSLI